MDTVKRTLRNPIAVDAALITLAREEGVDPSEYTTEILSRHVLQCGALDKIDAKQIRAEMAIKQSARALAKSICARKFDSHVTLKVFQNIRSDATLYETYKSAIGADGLDRRNPTQARINRSLGGIIKATVNGQPRTEVGNKLSIAVQGELIRTYTPLEKAARNTA